jgi:hypothetical protein
VTSPSWTGAATPQPIGQPRSPPGLLARSFAMPVEPPVCSENQSLSCRAVHLLLAPVRVACPVVPGGAATRSARCAGPAPRRPAAALPAARLPAGASGRKPPRTPAARRSPHRSSAAGHAVPGAPAGVAGRPAGSGWRSRCRPVRGSGSTDAPLRPACQVRPPTGRRRRPATRGCGPRVGKEEERPAGRPDEGAPDCRQRTALS